MNKYWINLLFFIFALV